MIDRYTRPEMARIWSEENKYRQWLEVELAAAEALAQTNDVPPEAARLLRKHASFDLKRIQEIEREVKHDVIAFTTHLAEIIGSEARFVHQGMTSSDVLDTCLSVQLKRAAEILDDGGPDAFDAGHEFDGNGAGFARSVLEQQESLLLRGAAFVLRLVPRRGIGCSGGQVRARRNAGRVENHGYPSIAEDRSPGVHRKTLQVASERPHDNLHGVVQLLDGQREFHDRTIVSGQPAGHAAPDRREVAFRYPQAQGAGCVVTPFVAVLQLRRDGQGGQCR